MQVSKHMNFLILADWNVQFPKAIRKDGARYVVEELKTSSGGDFYR